MKVIFSPLGWMLAVAAVIIWAELAWGAGLQCNTRARVLQELRVRYDERPLWIGVNHTGSHLLEIHASKDGSWSLTSTDTGKWTCLVAGGDGWTWGPYGERA